MVASSKLFNCKFPEGQSWYIIFYEVNVTMIWNTKKKTKRQQVYLFLNKNVNNEIKKSKTNSNVLLRKSFKKNVYVNFIIFISLKN